MGVTFAPGNTATYRMRRPYGVALDVPVVVLEESQGRVLVVAPLKDGGSRELWAWPESLRERGA